MNIVYIGKVNVPAKIDTVKHPTANIIKVNLFMIANYIVRLIIWDVTLYTFHSLINTIYSRMGIDNSYVNVTWYKET